MWLILLTQRAPPTTFVNLPLTASNRHPTASNFLPHPCPQVLMPIDGGYYILLSLPMQPYTFIASNCLQLPPTASNCLQLPPTAILAGPHAA